MRRKWTTNQKKGRIKIRASTSARIGVALPILEEENRKRSQAPPPE